MAYLPLFFVKLPANASLFNNKVIDIVSFSVFPTDEINWILFFLPEVEPFSLNLQDMGFDTTFTLLNLGSILYIMAFYLILLVLAIILKIFGRYISCCRAFYLKLYQALFWSGLLRFWMEIYLDVALCVTMNYVKMQDPTGFPSIAISNYLTYGMGAIIVTLPVWIIIFYSI